jgi:hypothetical protein
VVSVLNNLSTHAPAGFHEAFAVARSFSVTKPEPGPYGVVEVWRDGAAGG